MKIVVKNCSSPGASFTDNTNYVILSCYEWVLDYPDEVKPFVNFRKEVSKAKKFNDNNARNIFPLLKNCGFVNYEKGASIQYKYFFTKVGLAYCKALEAIENISNDETYSENQRQLAINKLKSINEKIIYNGIIKLLKIPDSNYHEAFLTFIRCFLEFGKMNKYEFAYMLHEMEVKSTDVITSMRDNILAYRNGELDFEVEVDVRNDNDIRVKSNQDRRQEGIGFLTAFSFFTALLTQSGLILKQKDYHELQENKRNEMEKIIEGV
jgi:hypothetical protein